MSQTVLETRTASRPGWLFPLLGIVIVGGLIGFGALAAGSDPARAWHIFLINFLFWSGIAMGGVAFAAIFQVAHARWVGPAKQLACACAVYLPVSFLFFLALWFGRRMIFPWVDRPVPLIASWLNTSSLFTREAIGLLVLYGMALLFAYRLMQSETPTGSNQKLAVILLLLYAYIYSVFAWDFVMSLHAPWTSTLFGGYYFIGNLYLSLAIITVLTVYATGIYGMRATLDRRIFHNLGKLLFSFSLLWTYLFWSQYLVIWYGNLPRETGYVLQRLAQSPWSALAVVVLIMNFVTPFVILMSRSAKENPTVLMTIAMVIIAGMWLERFLLVAPELTPVGQFPLGWAEILITAAFCASFALVYLTILPKIPILSGAAVSSRR